MTPLQIRKAIASIEKSKHKIAAERDKLRKVYDELCDLEDANQRAVDGLDEAISALSELL